MKIRVAKKIMKNKDVLNYGAHQIQKAESTIKKWKKNDPANKKAE